MKTGQQFEYVFDLGDCWTHRCAVLRDDIDPLDRHPTAAQQPTPYWGWGTIPDQYGRLWYGDDGESMPPEPPAELGGLGRNPSRIIAISEHECTVVLAIDPDETGEDEF